MRNTDRWIWPAPAKINLFLHVLGRRADGYHLLQTVFQLLDLVDSIDIRVDESGSIRRSQGPLEVAPEGDLAIRAARLLQHETSCRKGAEIAVHKRIPIGAGLGGGSSDAATVLVALNRMWGIGLSVDKLAEIGLLMGADVPVFVRGYSAWAEGIGESLTSIELPQVWYVIVFPEEAVSTPSVFADPALTRNTAPTTIPRFLSGELTRNDLQAVVLARCPRVAQAFNWLDAFGSPRMSGSGSSIFSAFADRDRAEWVANQCPKEWKAFVARGLLRSPLCDAVAAWDNGAAQPEQT